MILNFLINTVSSFSYPPPPNSLPSPAMSSKKIRTGHLSLDPYENAIVIQYEVEVTNNSTGQTETTQKETKVRLKTIKIDTNLSKLARDVSISCSKYFKIMNKTNLKLTHPNDYYCRRLSQSPSTLARRSYRWWSSWSTTYSSDSFRTMTLT